MNFGGCTLCDLQSSVLLPSKDGILLNLIGSWLYSLKLLDVAGLPALTRVIIGSAHTHDISGRSCWWHAYGRPMGLLRVVRLDLFPCEIGLIFKAQMLQTGIYQYYRWYCEINTATK